MSGKKIIYVGLDVDDKAFHGMGIFRETGEYFEFKCKPDYGVLRKKLNELLKTCTQFVYAMKRVTSVILTVVFFERAGYTVMWQHLHRYR